MSKVFPRQAYIRCYILNSLRFGPAPCEGLFDYGASEFGFSRAEIEDEAKRLGVLPEEIEGDTRWSRPSNLYAIWWGNRPARHVTRSMQQRDGGSAA